MFDSPGSSAAVVAVAAAATSAVAVLVTDVSGCVTACVTRPVDGASVTGVVIVVVVAVSDVAGSEWGGQAKGGPDNLQSYEYTIILCKYAIFLFF